MTSHWPEDERTVEVDPELVDTDPDVLDAEVAAERPLELTEDQLRGEDSPEGDLR